MFQSSQKQKTWLPHRHQRHRHHHCLRVKFQGSRSEFTKSANTVYKTVGVFYVEGLRFVHTEREKVDAFYVKGLKYAPTEREKVDAFYVQGAKFQE